MDIRVNHLNEVMRLKKEREAREATVMDAIKDACRYRGEQCRDRLRQVLGSNGFRELEAVLSLEDQENAHIEEALA